MMMRKLYKENCPSLWSDMKSESYGDDDMKNKIVRMTCVLMMRPRWLNDAKDEWLYMRRKKEKKKIALVCGFQMLLSWGNPC